MQRFRLRQMFAKVHKHTHRHTRMLVYAHKLYAPAFTCTHHNDVMYTCKQMQTHTHTHTHLYALTHAHPHTQTCCCPRRRLCMLQAHVFGSSKCMQKRRVVSVYMLTHRHTLTHTHTHTYTRTHVHTYTHTHSCNRMSLVSSAQKILHSWDTTASLYNRNTLLAIC